MEIWGIETVVDGRGLVRPSFLRHPDKFVTAHYGICARKTRIEKAQQHLLALTQDDDT